MRDYSFARQSWSFLILVTFRHQEALLKGKMPRYAGQEVCCNWNCGMIF